MEEQSKRYIAELIAKFRTYPGFSWVDLANDIETALDVVEKRGYDRGYELAAEIYGSDC